MKIATSINLTSCSREGELEINDSIALCVGAGFDAIEIDLSRGAGASALAGDDWEREIVRIRDAVQSCGARIVSAHAPHDPRLYLPDIAPSKEERAEFDKLLLRSAEAAKLLGAAILVVHPVDNMIDDEYDREVNRATNADYLSGVIAESRKQGIKVALENVYYSSEYRMRRRYGESAEEVCDLADTLGIGVCWNCGHAHPVTMDQGRAIEKVGERLLLVHISDSRGHTDAGLPPFAGGNIPWERIIPSLAKLGYKGYAVLQADRYLPAFPRELMPDAAALARTLCRKLEEIYANSVI